MVPKLFISYSWSNEEHEDWVLRLATELRENGVDVLLDKWDLKEGHDSIAFMEKMVVDEDIQKVILVIDEQYSEKANKKSGGVGTEAQILSAEIYESVDQSKFVAVIATENDGEIPKLPVFYKNRIYIDLSNEDLYSANFEQLLRWVFDKPLHIKPELGKKPKFLEDSANISIGTSAVVKRLLDAVKTDKSYAAGAIQEYFELFAENFEKFRLPPSEGSNEFDQVVYDNIEQFVPYRSELIEVFSAVARYSHADSISDTLHRFFETLLPYTERPENVTSYHLWDWDNLSFLVYECFLVCASVFLKYERFDVLATLLTKGYFVKKSDQGIHAMKNFSIFCKDLEVFNHRNKRLKLNRVSLVADLLKERCTDSGLSFNQLVQTDFLLYLSAAVQSIRKDEYQRWWPVTLVYHGRLGQPFEIFLRSESKKYFAKVAPTLSIAEKSELDNFVKGIEDQSVYVPKFQYSRINPLALMNFDGIATKP